MFENAIYSVISPEGCASILWRDPKKTLEAATAMKLTSKDLLELGIVPLENMIPEVALVKTMWALGNSEDNNGLKKLLLENISSEFS